jgi:methylmalonyl-CoA/ethylmalonyl-CoA epimerase
MIRRIAHIGIAVQKLDKQLEFWARSLGLPVAGIETVESEQVKVALLPAGESRIELIEPTEEASTISKHLTKRGAGMHHLALEVEDLQGLVDLLRDKGVALIGDAPRPGAGGRSVAFVHPRATGGVLLELVQVEAAGVEERNEIAPGATVLLYMREPQEKLWGVLRRLDSAGVVLEGIDLSSFDDWVAQIEGEEESVVGPSMLFMPMARLEKILLDRPSGHLPSLAQRFERRTGRRVQDVLAEYL